jgi:hypothetical protein
MIGPLAKCLVGECASVHPSTALEKALTAVVLFVIGMGVLFAITALLDEPSRRHRLHLFWKSKHCGRCQQEGRDLARSYRDHGLGNDEEAPR